MRLCGEAPPGALVERVSGGAYSLLVGASLTVVFECGHAARVFVAFDDDACGERCAAYVSSFLARLWIVNEEAYLLWVNGGGRFLEASA